MSRHKSLPYFNLFNSCLLAVTIIDFLLIFSLSYAQDKKGTIAREEIYSQLLKGTKLYYQNQYSETVETLDQVIGKTATKNITAGTPLSHKLFN